MIKLLLEEPTVGDSSQILIRSKLRAVSQRMGFSHVVREQMELVCAEMITNQNKYAGGSGLFQLWETVEPEPALELFAMDFGPGVVDLEQVLEDGFTTAGTMGKGLGAIRRLAHRYGFYSIPHGSRINGAWHGFAVWARFYRDAVPRAGAYEIGVYERAYQDVPNSGDCLCLRTDTAKVRWLHMDALGHGQHAARVIERAERFLDDAPVKQVLERISLRLQGTRGAVGVVAELDLLAGTIDLCGVGDMRAVLLAAGEKKVVNFAPGVLGHAHRSFDVLNLPVSGGALLLTASDGIRQTWDIGSFPGLWRLHPQMVALLLGNIVGRTSDDKSIFAIRAAGEKVGESHEY